VHVVTAVVIHAEHHHQIGVEGLDLGTDLGEPGMDPLQRL